MISFFFLKNFILSVTFAFLSLVSFPFSLFVSFSVSISSSLNTVPEKINKPLLDYHPVFSTTALIHFNLIAEVCQNHILVMHFSPCPSKVLVVFASVDVSLLEINSWLLGVFLLIQYTIYSRMLIQKVIFNHLIIQPCRTNICNLFIFFYFQFISFQLYYYYDYLYIYYVHCLYTLC